MVAAVNAIKHVAAPSREAPLIDRDGDRGVRRLARASVGCGLAFSGS
jgi:hypothetical protein